MQSTCRPRCGAPGLSSSKARIALGTDQLEGLADGLRRAESLGHPAREPAVLRAIAAVRQGRHAEARPILRSEFERSCGPDRLLDEAMARAAMETDDLVLAERAIGRWATDAPNDPKPWL